MADDLSKQGPADRIRISVKQYHERRYWVGALGVSEKRLREAVKEVGPMVKDVKAFLIKKIEEA